MLTRAQRAVGGSDGRDWLDVAARVGLTAYGVVHLVIAWLALQLAFGDREGSPSSSGAVSELAQQPFGKVLVWAVAVSEAVALVRDLSTDDSPAFVNGVLGAVLRQSADSSPS